MSRLPFRSHAEQRVLLAACTTRTAPIASTRRPLPVGAPARAVDVLFDLRAEDVSHAELAATRARLLLPLRNPDTAMAELLRWSAHVSASRDVAFEAVMVERGEASAERYADLAAATWMDEAIDRLIAEKVRFVLDAFAARPELVHDHAVLMTLAHVVAMLKGSVA